MFTLPSLFWRTVQINQMRVGLVNGHRAAPLFRPVYVDIGLRSELKLSLVGECGASMAVAVLTKFNIRASTYASGLREGSPSPTGAVLCLLSLPPGPL